MLLQPGKQTITIHILPNISNKINQTVKFGHLVKYNMRNVFFFFLKNHTQNVVEKLFPDRFLENQN